MSANKESYDQLLVIFGASGDLTSRKLLPAFSELFSRGLLPDRFAILGAARSDFSDISFRRSRRQVLKGDRADEFLGKVYYLRFDPADPRAYPKLAKRIVRLRGELRLPDRILYYLATPPSMYPVIAQGLLESGLNVPEGEGGWRRIIVEKPFGSDLETARRLNGLLQEYSPSARYTGSTTIWGRKPSKTFWYCVFRTESSSRCGTGTTSTGWKYGLPKPSA